MIDLSYLGARSLTCRGISPVVDSFSSFLVPYYVWLAGCLFGFIYFTRLAGFFGSCLVSLLRRPAIVVRLFVFVSQEKGEYLERERERGGGGPGAGGSPLI